MIENEMLKEINDKKAFLHEKNDQSNQNEISYHPTDR
jgi:hypothetical protein